MSIKKDWLEKNAKEALFMGKPYSVLAFSFGPDEKNYYILDENLFLEVLNSIANGKELAEKYKNHKLINDKTFKECYECHIQPDWLLVYKVQDNELVLLLFATGSHSDLFNK